MSDEGEVKQRLDRLRQQRQARAGQHSPARPFAKEENLEPAAQRGRPGLRALMMAARTAPAPAAQGKGGRLPGGLAALAPLLKNPDIRHVLLQWLQNQESGAGRSSGGENAWGLELGIETMPRAEELTTSSTLEEISRYYQQLENRVDWLEAALEETLLEMERVSRFKLAASEAGESAESLTPPIDPAI
jgi:hypothetical protein